MIKKLFIYVALVMGFVACSDDLFNTPLETLPSNGELPISFAVPEMTKTLTRGDLNQNAFDDVLMLVFDSSEPSSAKLVQKEILKNADSQNVTITIDKEYRSNSNLFFIFLANSSYQASDFPVSKTNPVTLQNVMGMTETILSQSGERMVMSGSATLGSLLRFEPVNLFRNAAKVSLTVSPRTGEDGSEIEITENKSGYAFNVYGAPIEGNSSSMAGSYNTNSLRSLLGNPVNVNAGSSFADNLNQNGEVFVAPEKNTGTYVNRSFIIVKGKYKGSFYYYRLDFQTEADGVLDILPNHHYEVEIKGDPVSAGSATPQEAVKNPVPLSQGWYEIHDHSPKIFRMITDGVRELGVDYELRNKNSNVGSTAIFYVKVFSSAEGKAAEEVADFKTNYRKYITFSQPWLEAISIEEVDGADYDGTIGQGPGDTDSNDKGQVYAVTVLFKDNGGMTGVLEESATITWKGLSREMPVIWERVFDPDELYESVTLTIQGGGLSETIDYFPFLVGTFDDNGNRLTDPKVWGVSADANNGESRDQGFHFPMPYGNDAVGYAAYSYTITMKPLGVEGESYTWSYRLVGDDELTNSSTGVKVETTSNSTLTNSGGSGETGPVLRLTYDSSIYNSSRWKYGVAQLIITVNGETEIPINLYHTGFFHKDNTSWLSSTYRPEADSNRPWTYYEVATMGDQHWLDRNIGAHSAEMYIESSGDVTYMGNQEAVGGYYRVADYNRGGKPQMRTADICPPGYDFPTNDEYNRMRGSAAFSTASVGNYNEACYSADLYGKGSGANGAMKQKLVYFPKGRYLSSEDSKNGESRAGYYWTQTAASGVEKDEMGAWLKCFMVSGAATSYINGEVQSLTAHSDYPVRKYEFKGFAMPVRCVSVEGRDNNPMTRTSFFVTGVTHVFLYTLDSDNNKNAVTSWPGTAICSANAIGKTYNVAYESQVNTSDKLYVIFNYKDKDGKIHTISRNPDEDLVARFTDNEGVKTLTGWKVEDGIAPDWDNYGDKTIITELNGYWIFDFSKKEGGFTLNAPEGSITPANPVHRLYWPKNYGSNHNKNYTGMNLWVDGGMGSVKNGTYSIYQSEGDYYYCDIENWTTGTLKIQGRWDNSYDDNHVVKLVLSDFSKTENIDGTSYKCFTLDSNMSDNDKTAAGQVGRPTGGNTGGDNNNSYRLYVKKWQENLRAINCWFTAGGNGAAPKGLFTDSWWTGSVVKDGATYYYIDMTINGDFTMNWQPVYGDNEWDVYWDNGDLKVNKGSFGDAQTVTQNSFTYDASLGKRVCKLTGWNESSGGQPVRRKQMKRRR